MNDLEQFVGLIRNLYEGHNGSSLMRLDRVTDIAQIVPDSFYLQQLPRNRFNVVQTREVLHTVNGHGPVAAIVHGMRYNGYVIHGDARGVQIRFGTPITFGAEPGSTAMNFYRSNLNKLFELGSSRNGFRDEGEPVTLADLAERQR